MFRFRKNKVTEAPSAQIIDESVAEQNQDDVQLGLEEESNNLEISNTSEKVDIVETVDKSMKAELSEVLENRETKINSIVQTEENESDKQVLQNKITEKQVLLVPEQVSQEHAQENNILVEPSADDSPVFERKLPDVRNDTIIEHSMQDVDIQNNIVENKAEYEHSLADISTEYHEGNVIAQNVDALSQEKTPQSGENNENNENLEDAKDFLLNGDSANEDEDLANRQYAENTYQERAGIAQKIFHSFSYIALPTLILLTLALSFQQFLFPRDFWFSEEVRFADVYMNMLTSGDFFHLTLNGLPFAQAGPLYFLSIFAIDSIPGVAMPQAFFIASTVFASLYIAVVWLFARVMGLGKHGAFAAGLIALSTFFFIGLSNYNRMDLLHAALLNLSFLFFYYGWKKKNGFFSLTFAFIFLALSVLINGFMYVLIPFVAGFLFLFWAKRTRRIIGGDGLLGFFIFLILLFGWYGLLYFYGQSTYINELISVQVLEPFAIASYSKPLWYYALGFVLISLPWFLLFVFANWFQCLKKIPQYCKNRENASIAWLICILITSLALLTFTHNKQFVNLMPLMPVLAILLAKILMSLSPIKSKLFYIVLAFVIFCLGLLFVLFEFHAIVFEYLPKMWMLPTEIPTYIAVATTNTHFGMAAMGGIFIFAALILWKFTRKTHACGALLVSTFWFVVAVQPFSMLVAPQLDSILSPKTQANLIAEYAQKGFVPASFGVYPDVYTYYYNEAYALDEMAKTGTDNGNAYPQKTVKNLATLTELNQFLATNPKVVLAITAKDYHALPNKVYSQEIQKQWLESKEVLITLWEVPQMLAPNTDTTDTVQSDVELTDMNLKDTHTEEIDNIEVNGEEKEPSEALEKAEEVVTSSEMEAIESVVEETSTQNIANSQASHNDSVQEQVEEFVEEQVQDSGQNISAQEQVQDDTSIIEVTPEDSFLFEKNSNENIVPNVNVEESIINTEVMPISESINQETISPETVNPETANTDTTSQETVINENSSTTNSGE